MTVAICPRCNHPSGVSFGSPNGRWSRECPHPFLWESNEAQREYDFALFRVMVD